MKFINLSTEYKVSKEKLKAGISIAVVLLFSAVSVVVIKTLIDNQEKKLKLENDALIVSLLEETDIEALESTTASEASTETTNEDNLVALTYTDETSESGIVETTSESVLETSYSEVSESTTITSAQVTEITLAPTATPIPTPTKPPYSETSLSKKVYASGELNVRSGPGTDYSIVKTIDKGSAIDVIGETDTGWYHTYNGNWVVKSLCQDNPVVVATPTPVPVQTTATAATTTTTTTQAPVSTTAATSKDGMTYYGSCTITFYGPQKTSSGSYSTTTATGTTCTQGVTCAADWSVFPAGTVIYIENDPLGGDGYYTVEDKGPGVKGSHIDIYANDGESNAYSTTTKNVYIVN